MAISFEPIIYLSDAGICKEIKSDFSRTSSNDDEVILNESILKYFFISNRLDNLPNDPVARFHLGNGAILERINFYFKQIISFFYKKW